MRKIRYWLRLIGAFVQKFKLLLFFGLLFGFFAFVIARVLVPLMWGGNVERIGMTGRYHVEDLPEEVISLVSIGLTTIDDEGRVQPGLSESWWAEDEGKTWVFELTEGWEWHDGEEVAAEDLNYQFDGGVEVEKKDNKKIVFRLKDPLASFEAIVARPVFRKGLIGVGEWEVSRVSLAGEYVERVVLRRGRDRKIFSFYPTEDKLKTAFKLGSVDILHDLLEPSPFDAWDTVEVTARESADRYVAIFLNNQNEAFLGNKALRQALFYAIDKEALSGARAYGPISPNSWAYNPQVKDYEFDRGRAEELLSEMGDEFLEKMELKLVTSPILLEVTEKIANDWREVGINTTVLVSSVTPLEYQAFVAIADVSRDPDQYALWHSTQGETNISNYSNPRIDKLLEDGRRVLDEEDRKKVYLDFQRFLLEDAPAIFLYHPMSYTVSRK